MTKLHNIVTDTVHKYISEEGYCKKWQNHDQFSL